MSLSTFVLCTLVQHSSAAHSSSCFPPVPYDPDGKTQLLIFVSALWGSSPSVLCSQGPDVLLGEPEGPSQTGLDRKLPESNGGTDGVLYNCLVNDF